MRMQSRPAALRFLLAQLLVLQPSSHGKDPREHGATPFLPVPNWLRASPGLENT